MVPVSVLPEKSRNDIEFDLDVRLQVVARHVFDQRAEEPRPQGTITECTCPATKCEC